MEDHDGPHLHLSSVGNGSGCGAFAGHGGLQRLFESGRSVERFDKVTTRSRANHIRTATCHHGAADFGRSAARGVWAAVDDSSDTLAAADAERHSHSIGFNSGAEVFGSQVMQLGWLANRSSLRTCRGPPSREL
jgi:hypothetical protein